MARAWGVGVKVRTFLEEEEFTQICRGKKEYSVFRLQEMARPTRSVLHVGVGTGVLIYCRGTYGGRD